MIRWPLRPTLLEVATEARSLARWVAWGLVSRALPYAVTGAVCALYLARRVRAAWSP